MLFCLKHCKQPTVNRVKNPPVLQPAFLIQISQHTL